MPNEAIPPGVITESDALKAAPRWRRDPFLLFFPLGVLLSWAGVGTWLAFALGGTPHYRSIFHSMTQVQGFLLCFAAGFLFTMIPRRTGTQPPSTAEMGIALVAPVLTAVAAWNEWWMLSQVGWLAACTVLVVFVVRRFVSATARRRPPNSFVWIPVALVMGFVGSVMTGVYGALGAEWMWMHTMGQVMVLQGVFVALVLGVGGLALPLMTRGVAPADGSASDDDRLARLGHLAAASLLLASFAVEVTGDLRMAMLLRGLVVLVVLVASAELWKPPLPDGWNRRLIWLSAWMLPAGFFLAALYPEHYKGALHVSFVGGFGLLALAVGMQVTLGHGGFRSLMLGRPWQVAAIGALGSASVVARVAADFDRPNYMFWTGCAAALFLAATVVWAAFLIPKMIRPAPAEG